MAIEAVLFDLYNTLLLSDDRELERRDAVGAFAQTLADHGVSISSDRTLEHVFDHAVDRTAEDDFTVFERRLNTFLESEGIVATSEAIQSSAAAILRTWEPCWALDRDAMSVLSEIRERRYATALVTNFDHYPYVRSLLPRLGIADLFDEVVISSEVGFDKPQPEIFHLALQNLRVAPGSAVHIGDDDVDISGAHAAGVRPIRISRKGRVNGDETTVTSLRELLMML